MKSLKILITLSVITFLLTGCSFYSDLYFINKTDKNVVVTILLSSDIEEIKKEDDLLQLKYRDSVLKVNDKTIDQLTEKLGYEAVDSKTIKIKLPPNSTTLIGGGYNGIPRQIEKYKISMDNITNTLTTEELASLTEKTGGAFPPFHFTYVIE